MGIGVHPSRRWIKTIAASRAHAVIIALAPWNMGPLHQMLLASGAHYTFDTINDIALFRATLIAFAKEERAYRGGS